MLRQFAHVVLLGSLSLQVFAQATSQDVDASRCQSLGQAVLGAVHAPGDEVRALACRTIPKESVTLVAVAHAPAAPAKRTSDMLPIHVGLIGMKHGQVRATGQIGMAEDSERAIDESSLAWDDAPLELAPGRSGYALRLTPAYRAGGAAESGQGTSMTLFLAEQGRMRPVLGELSLSSWDQICERPPCNHDEVTTRTFTTTYVPAKTSSHGLKDIVLTTTMDEDASTMKRRVARFDGTRYFVPD